jgi:hypothetical protein
MGQLRAKLETNPTEPALLLTEPGVGYSLAEAAVCFVTYAFLTPGLATCKHLNWSAHVRP